MFLTDGCSNALGSISDFDVEHVSAWTPYSEHKAKLSTDATLMSSASALISGRLKQFIVPAAHLPRASPRSFVRGNGFIGTQTHLPNNLASLRNSATLFWKCWKIQTNICFKKKYTGISKFMWGGGRPRGFQKCGVLTPATPLLPSAIPLWHIQL